MDVIDRMRVLDNEKLQEIVRSHLTVLLDLDELEQLMSDSADKFNGKSSDNLRHSMFNSSSKKKDTTNGKQKKMRLFGCCLTIERIYVIEQLIQFIASSDNITQEGIFRKSGSASRQAELKNWLSCGTEIVLEESKFTVHDCASVLKIYLSELPEPLLLSSHLKAHCQIGQMGRNVLTTASPLIRKEMKAKQLKSVQLLLMLLPSTNRSLLSILLDLLHKVADNSDSNKMDSRSLATLFAPNLFCPKSFSAIDLHKCLLTITDALHFMIDNSKLIFEAPKELIIDVSKYMTISSQDNGGHDIDGDVYEDASDAPISSSIVFCQRSANTNVSSNNASSIGDAENFTQMQLAKLYADVQAMPETPQKKKLIKRFNRENGLGTPMLTRHFDAAASTLSAKKNKGISSVLKAGQNFFFRGNSARNSSNISGKTNSKLQSQQVKSASLDALSTPSSTSSSGRKVLGWPNKQMFKRSASTDFEMQMQIDSCCNENSSEDGMNSRESDRHSICSSEHSNGHEHSIEHSSRNISDNHTPLGLALENVKNKRIKTNVNTPGNRETLAFYD